MKNEIKSSYHEERESNQMSRNKATKYRGRKRRKDTHI